ncbi:polysaccharide pyruvyl transferase, partial [Streptomyces sp. SID5926]|nr:polysaccharide pyruvyl transferase [Streptomyces sp. SID5926]
LWDEYPRRRDDLRDRMGELSAAARESCERCGALLDGIAAARGPGGVPAAGAGPYRAEPRPLNA